MVAVWRRYKGVRIEVILHSARGHWRCEEVRVSRDRRETPVSLEVRGAFADVMAAVAAARALAETWIDEHGESSDPAP